MKNLALEKSERLEDSPNRAKMRQNDNPARGIHDRYHNRNDYPWKRVWRFITSNVGQNWDEVYSKYCKLDWVPDRFKTIERIGDTVILNTFYRDGEVWYYEKYGGFTKGNEQKVSESYRESFYVHPKNKILCRQQPKPKNKNQYVNEQAKTMRILGNYHQLLKIDGIWHEVKAEPVKDNIIEVDGLHYQVVPWRWTTKDDKTKYTIIDGKICIPHQYSRFYDDYKIGAKDRLIEDKKKGSPFNCRKPNYGSIKIILCRQLNSKELKKHGIQNDKKFEGIRCKKCGGIAGKDCINHICSICGKYLREDCQCWPWRN